MSGEVKLVRAPFRLDRDVVERALGFRELVRARRVELQARLLDYLPPKGPDLLCRVCGIPAASGHRVGCFFGAAGPTCCSDSLIEQAIALAELVLEAAGFEGRPLTPSRRKLDGKVFVLTGTLPKRSRDQAKDEIREHGGLVEDKVTSRVDYLLAGSRPGDKLLEARLLKIATIDEAEFERMIHVR